MNPQIFSQLVAHRILEIAILLILYYNPCQIEGDTCKAGKNFCCYNTIYNKGTCRYWRGKCIHENVDCRLWFCATALEGMDEVCKEAFFTLEKLAKQYGLIQHPYLGEPYAYGADKMARDNV